MLCHFSPLPENVARPTLRRSFVDSSTLTAFISRFPRLHDLSVSTLESPRKASGIVDSSGGPHSRAVPSHPRGEFSAWDMKFDEPEKVFAVIALLKPRFRRVTIKHASYDQWRIFWPIVEACAGSLEELEILRAASIGERTHLEL